jgi:hypothetical protein
MVLALTSWHFGTGSEGDLPKKRHPKSYSNTALGMAKELFRDATFTVTVIHTPCSDPPQ